VTDALYADIYRKPRPHEVELPRAGDHAEIRRDHCQPETGLVVRVFGDPHLCVARCHKCGQRIEEWMVEVFARHEPWQRLAPGGPYFYPIAWLKRIDPADPASIERIHRFEMAMASKEQWLAASA
jgi:hypothetical protein